MHVLLEKASAIFFDLDGTLVDSATDIHAALNLALAEHQLPQVTEHHVRTWIGRGARVLVELAVAHCVSQSDVDTPKDRVAILIDAVLRDFLHFYQLNVSQHTRIYDGVMSVLMTLKGSEKHLACITNKPIQPAQTLLENLGLAPYFSLVLGGDSLAHKKPHPLPLQHALTHYHLQPVDALMIGDSQFDIQAAQAANMPCIAVTGGYNHGIPISRSRPTVIIESFHDLL